MSTATEERSGTPLGIEKGHAAPLLGASLLSAAGSLPLHLMPLIVVALIAEGRTSILQAGWIATAVLLGQLVATLVLPILRIDSVRRRFTVSASIALIVGLLTTRIHGATALLLGWGIVGACCGLLQYVGTTTAANHVRPVFAFSLRLGVVLVVAGFVAGSARASGVLATYGSLLVALCVIIGSILAAGVALYRVSVPRANGSAPFGFRTWSTSLSSGLAATFILFVGQTGFLAYAVQGAVSRGIALDDAAWAVAGMKFAAGVALLSLAQRGLNDKQRPRFLELGLLLGVSLVIVALANGPFAFFVGLLGVELGLNFLSARLLGKVAETAPQSAGRWLTGTILLGAASGPPVHGAMLSLGMGRWFLFFAVFSSLAPFLWFRIWRIRTNPRES